jgi:ABC-type glycerol-3-phosphate transport system permease component
MHDNKLGVKNTPMLSFIAVVLIALGAYVFSLAFRPGRKVLFCLVVGGALLTLGFTIFPRDSPDIELPENWRR